MKCCHGLLMESLCSSGVGLFFTYIDISKNNLPVLSSIYVYKIKKQLLVLSSLCLYIHGNFVLMQVVHMCVSVCMHVCVCVCVCTCVCVVK